MQRRFKHFSLPDNSDLFKEKLLNFGMEFSNFCFLENNHYHFDKSYDTVAAFGQVNAVRSGEYSRPEDLSLFQNENKDWIFGHTSYDFKNQLENLTSENFDGIGFHDFFFFVPAVVLIIEGTCVSIGTTGTDTPDDIFSRIINVIPKNTISKKPILQSRFNKKDYLSTVDTILQHIAAGDCYEICFCQEFFANDVQLDPVKTFMELNVLSPNPFAAFYKLDEHYLLCASPERFMKKTGREIISQPIKGTRKRTAAGTDTDQKEAQELLKDRKERAENIMIVDLVRNDLSKVCLRGTVEVREYLKVHSLPGVHQMISTIKGLVPADITLGELLTAAFPMGSMTGAPKIKAMELIEKYERTKRGLYSGSVGYIDPGGNFDFNVVIRSILYNELNKYLSVQAGSAITSASNPHMEYEECLAKAEAIFKCME